METAKILNEMPELVHKLEEPRRYIWSAGYVGVKPVLDGVIQRSVEECKSDEFRAHQIVWVTLLFGYIPLCFS